MRSPGDWKSFSVEMKRLGYLSSTDFVLQDVEEHERSRSCVGSSVQVRDSTLGFAVTHSAIKFTSSFERQEIFERDTNQFYHFKDGVCSCEVVLESKAVPAIQQRGDLKPDGSSLNKLACLFGLLEDRHSTWVLQWFCFLFYHVQLEFLKLHLLFNKSKVFLLNSLIILSCPCQRCLPKTTHVLCIVMRMHISLPVGCQRRKIIQSSSLDGRSLIGIKFRNPFSLESDRQSRNIINRKQSICACFGCLVVSVVAALLWLFLL